MPEVYASPLVDLHYVKRFLGIGRTKIYDLLRDDERFPQPVALGPKARSVRGLRWYKAEIEEYAATCQRRDFRNRPGLGHNKEARHARAS